MGTFINSTPSGRTSLAERSGPSQAKESAGNEEDSEGSGRLKFRDYVIFFTSISGDLFQIGHFFKHIY